VVISAVVAFPPAPSFTTVARFVDTNVLVYAEDLDAGPKHQIARDLVLDLWAHGDGVLSAQVLEEFFVTVTRKIKHPMAGSAALRIVEEYLTWVVVAITGPLVVDAIRRAQASRLSFWDALVIQSAISADCEELLTEDLNPGQRMGRLRVSNPFV
jgi:predicted nucleic acid-binding protein